MNIFSPSNMTATSAKCQFYIVYQSYGYVYSPERRISLSGLPDNCEKDPGIQNEHMIQVTQWGVFLACVSGYTWI